MTSLLSRFKTGAAMGSLDPSLSGRPNMSLFQGDAKAAAKEAQKKKEEPPPELTPLEKMLQNAGPVREDGSDKFYGLENFGNTCYCNSMVQALYYTTVFRENVLNYPPLSPSETPEGFKPKVNVVVRAPLAENGTTNQANGKKTLTTAEALARRKQINSGQVIPATQQGIRPEDKPDTPEYKKKQAMLKGPILELAQENPGAYGMDECTFTGLRDIFMTLVEANTRTGVLSPQRFLEIFKRDNEMFRNSMHQDAHEFYGLVLNDVISNVERNAMRLMEQETKRANDGLLQSLESALSHAVMPTSNGVNSPGTGWVHDIFEGVLTSETKCLTCETTSQRDETFLDLSIDLEEHSSVTSCLQKFSAEEMLCERNKFHCDHCGGLQEAEKRMKIKRLPKVLALHLKRFKYTEDYSRLQKLFHRVVYPYELRMFNTTEDAEDPDRLYELYAVIVHIGGNAYHGHYVSVIKTEDRGWLLFDDEMVEPVDKHYVRNFFGDKPGMACAYVLLYQETTFEKVRAQQEAEGLEEVRIASEKANVATEENGQGGVTNGLTRQVSQPNAIPTDDPLPTLLNQAEGSSALARSQTAKADPKSKEERKEAKAAEKAAEKARKAAEKDEQKAKEKQRKERETQLREARKTEAENLKKALEESKKTAEEEPPKAKEASGPNIPSASGSMGLLNRTRQGSKSMSRKSLNFLSKDKSKRENSEGPAEPAQNGEAVNAEKPPHTPTIKERFSFSLGRKKSHNVLS
ncbi:ubiquitin hydrolase CreB [Apiospora phragmitis]|uniref:Ubiquitin carboxyl-terminal hydrolase n=1 Tax=Apiospora phragmitis TaxID=2905665 RepID=A0ABR1TUC0_9PEZI